MDFKYKVSFSSKVKTSSIFEEDEQLCTASLLELAKYLPENVKPEINQDLLPISFNAAVGNQVNKNDDGCDAKTLVEMAKYFINKPINLEHKRGVIRGTILGYAFTQFGSNLPLSEEEAKATKEPFNLTLNGVIWRIVDKEFASYLEDCSNPDSANFEECSASWEIAFSENNLILLPKDKTYYKDGLIVTSEDKDYKKISEHLRSNGGNGVWGEFRVCRDIILPALPLGIGITENPAGSVKGIVTMLNKVISAETEEHPEDCKEEKESFSKVEYKDKELYQKVRKDADNKFGAENSYVKNLWVLREYKKRGGKTKFSGKKPNSDEIKKSVRSAVIHVEMDEYQDEVEAAEKVKRALNKPFRTPGGPKKFGVYVKNDKGNIVLVRFGDPNMEIKRDDPERRKNFRARHNCDQKKDKTTPGYWSCKMWSKKPVSDIT